MFDNTNLPVPPVAPAPTPSSQPPVPPTASMPQPPADMFAGLDAGLGSPIPPVGSAPVQPVTPGMDPEPAGGNRKYFVVGFLVLLLIGIIVGGYFAYAKFSSMVNKDEEPAAAETSTETGKPEAATGTKPAVETSDSPVSTTTGSVVDAASATPTSSPLAGETATTTAATSTVDNAVDKTKDSDSDGLSDYEEVNFYKSNPAVADTDGDGFADGAEVKNGFNPLGAGKMIDSQIK